MGPPGPAGSGTGTSSARSLIWSAYAPGSLERTFVVGHFTPDVAITVTRIQVQLVADGGNCRRDPTLTLSNGTPRGTYLLHLNGASVDSGTLSMDVSAGTPLVLMVDGQEGGCRWRPADANIVVQYKTK